MKKGVWIFVGLLAAAVLLAAGFEESQALLVSHVDPEGPAAQAGRLLDLSRLEGGLVEFHAAEQRELQLEVEIVFHCAAIWYYLPQEITCKRRAT